MSTITITVPAGESFELRVRHPKRGEVARYSMYTLGELGELVLASGGTTYPTVADHGLPPLPTDDEVAAGAASSESTAPTPETPAPSLDHAR